MKTRVIPPSELVLNDDGSIYHLKLKPEHVAHDVILVGDQDRVARISRHFDSVEFKIRNREFITHTGIYQGRRLTVISTGIGTDNIDIVLNELDAAVNIDLQNRILKENRKVLNIIRLGTCGALHSDIDVGSFIISEFGLGFDGLAHYYGFEHNDAERPIHAEILRQLAWNPRLAEPYLVGGDNGLIFRLGPDMIPGITATATGFYGPQGRQLALPIKMEDMNDRLASFSYQGLRITNFEMETSGLFALGRLMGHRCATCCTVLANRTIKKYVEDKNDVVDNLITEVLTRLVQ